MRSTDSLLYLLACWNKHVKIPLNTQLNGQKILARYQYGCEYGLAPKKLFSLNIESLLLIVNSVINYFSSSSMINVRLKNIYIY